jgi:hypothetical protein
MVHRRVAGRSAEDAAVAGDGIPGHGGEDGALARSGRSVNAEEIACREGALDREALLGIQRVDPLGGFLGLEARALPAEEHRAAPAGSAPVTRGDLGDGGVGAAERHVVRDQVHHQSAGPDEVGGRTIERELQAAAAAPDDQRPLGWRDFRPSWPGLHHVAGAERIAPGLAPSAGQGDQETAAEPDVLVGCLEVSGREAQRLALPLREAGPLAGKPLLLGAALEREEAAQVLEVLGPGWSGGHAPSCHRKRGGEVTVDPGAEGLR